MASYQTSQYIDTLTVNTIFTKGDSNTNIPAFRVLTTDGVGGTMWMTLSSLQYGAGYHTIVTTGATYTADSATNASFSLLDGPNAGLINDPTASNTAYLYAKAFGQFDISGGNSIYCFDSNTNTVNSNVIFVGTGGINIKGDPQTNTMFIDGRELPFVSTLPYSFNQMVVYSNAPLNTIAGSTVNKSIILQAQGPSSILSFLGEDMIVIDTNYEKNQIKFKLSSLTLSVLSTLVGDTNFLKTYAVNSIQLSTLSTSYGQIISFQNLQLAICTMSTTLDNKIAYNSTIIGDVSVYSKGISSVWREFQLNQYFTGINAASNLVSTAGVLQSELDLLNQRVFTEGQDLIGSTLRTPYFWTSTIANQIYAAPQPINTPTPSVKPFNAAFYNSYPSYYNVFNDTQPFGSPIQPTTYPTSVDITSGTNTFSTVSTLSGIKFSTLYAIQGTFVFLPNEDPHPFSVKWSGNLSFNINGTEYASNPIPYPRMNAYVTSNTLSGSIHSQPVCIVNFSYSKINPTDFLTFSNLTDYVAGGIEYYNVAPIYNAYGYNTNESPIYTKSIASFPVGFSSMSNLVGSPYLQLSTYAMIASTFYTSGCNTTFPVATSGYTSLTFYESTTKISKTAYNINLSNGPTSNFPLSPFSASNAFGYDFTAPIPNSPYTLEIVYARQNDPEIFLISTLYSQNFQYSFNPTFYMSSALYTQYTSSINTDIKNLSVSTINGVAYANLQFTDVSTISTIYWNILTLTSSLSSSVNNYSASLVQYGTSAESSMSTIYIGINEILSTISSSLNNYSSSLIQYGTSAESSMSTIYIGLNEILSSISSSLNNFSASLVQYGTSADSTISTTYTSLDQITSTLIGDIDIFSTSLIDMPNPSSISTVDGRVTNLSTSLIYYTSGESRSSFSTFTYSFSHLSTDLVYYTSGSNLSTVSTANTTFSNMIGSNTSSISSLTQGYSILSTSIVFYTSGSNLSTVSTANTTFSNMIGSNTSSISSINSALLYSAELYTSTLFTSSVKLAGFTQPFIQYGNNIVDPPTPITLLTPYINATYAIQLTYSNNTQPISTLFTSSVASNQFYVTGDIGAGFYWTTFGQLF